MPAKYGITTAAGESKPAATTVARWNNGGKRHTVYTVCGTTQDAWGLYNDTGVPAEMAGMLYLLRQVTGNPAATLPANDGDPLPDAIASPDAAVGRRVNSALFDWVPVSYPASGPAVRASLENNWQPTNLSIADSVSYGVTELVNLIKATPGTFALVGMSQGAIVTSQVLKALLPGGALASRYKDCIAGVAFGNPCRKIGGSMPGVPAAEGGGILHTTSRNAASIAGLQNANVPNWWWEMAITGDFFASAPMHTAAGPVITPVVQSLGTFRGSADLTGTMISGMFNAFLAGAVPVVTAALQGAISFLFAPKSVTAQQALSTWLYQQFGAPTLVDGQVVLQGGAYPNGNPHIRYGVDSPPNLPTWPGLTGLTASSTYIDVAVAYLNARGAAVAPR